MYALRLLYQRHRKLAPFAGAMVALFFVTLITTMPMPRADALETNASAPDPVRIEPVPAGDLAVLMSEDRLETLGDGELAFIPTRGAF